MGTGPSTGLACAQLTGMRLQLVVAMMLLLPASSALPQVSIQFSLPSVRIGINQPAFPQLVLVPGYPVYYDPGSSSNFFFYDGLYWVYAGDNWYASDWYNGPWMLVAPYDVPIFILRVPVSYYRSPPTYFRSWQRDAPPRWGEHWGHDWERRRAGWDRWNRNEAPPPAPLPVYQRQYSGTRYPDPQQQRALQSEHYRHEPRDTAVRQLVQPQPRQAQPEPQRQVQPQPETQKQAQPQPEPQRQAQPQREPQKKAQPQPEPQRQAQPQRAPKKQAQPQPEPQRQAQPQGQRTEPATPAPNAQPAPVTEDRGRQGGAVAPAPKKKAKPPKAEGQGQGRER